MVSSAQIILLALSILSYLAGGVSASASLMGKRISAVSRPTALGLGLLFSTVLLVWHSARVVRETGGWQPLQDNLSAMLTLAVLLAAFVAYIQVKRPVPSLEWLAMPVVILLLLMAGHFGTAKPETYLPTTYSVVHRVTTYIGAVAFMVAGVSGVLYLLSDRNLRHRKRQGQHVPPQPGVFGSLERLEHLTYTSVTLGFALFSVGLITGLIWLHHDGSQRMGPTWYFSPKVIFGAAAWLIFAIVLHTPIAPRLRGRKNALLSIVGLVLTLASIVAVLLMPAGGAR